MIRAFFVSALCIVATGALAQEAPKEKAFWGLASDAPSYEIAGGKAIAILSSQGHTYMGILVGKPGLKVPVHTHAVSTEMLYILSGGGTMIIDGKRHAVTAGMVIRIPPGTPHGFEIAPHAKTEFRAVQVYSPAGPEQRFKKGRLLPQQKGSR